MCPVLDSSSFVPIPMLKGQNPSLSYERERERERESESVHCKCTTQCSTAHFITTLFNPLNAELNPICHMLALLGAHHILHVSRIRVNVGNVLLCITYQLNFTTLIYVT
jgi:hypothetical protein